jgi:hypothetical protein
LPPLTLAEAAAQAERDAVIAHTLETAAEAGLAAAQAMAELDADFSLFDLPQVPARGQAA